MIDKAIEKITTEANTSKDPIVKMLSKQIIDNIVSLDRATKVLAVDKTLSGCKKVFDDYAKTHKSGNCSVIGPDDAQELINKYFGFTPAAPKRVVKEVSNKTIKTIDIFDYL